MIDKKLNEIRSKLKQAFPQITREIDNLVGNAIEDAMDPSIRSHPIDDIKQDLIYTLKAHRIEFNQHEMEKLFK